MLFSEGFEWFLCAVCAVLAIVFFIGKGKKLIEGFGGNARTDMRVKRKKTPEEELLYQRILGVFCLVLAANEAFMALFARQYSWCAILGMVIVGVTLVVLVIILRKKFPDE